MPELDYEQCGKEDMMACNNTYKPAALSPEAAADKDLCTSDTEVYEDDLPCKWGPLKCRFCQMFRNPKVVLLLLCCASWVQGMMITGFIGVIITSLEKRFHLKSADSGLIPSSYDIASVISLIPVAYFGGLGKKPCWLGFGMILLSVGSFIFALPHFTTDLYQYVSLDENNFCDVSQNATSSPTCSDSASGLQNYKYMFIFAMVLNGIGSTPLYTLGVTYIDENLTQKQSTIYVAIYNLFAIIGPATGFLMGGSLLRWFTDFDVLDSASLAINYSSESWVGAWWPGFLITSGLAFIFGMLLLGLPKYLPNTAVIRAEKISEAYNGEKSIVSTQGGFGSLRDLPRTLKLILTNRTFMFLSIGGAAEGILISGNSTFLPKYLESQFNVSSSTAALVVGVVAVIAGGIGTLIGGVLVNRFDLKVTGTIKLCIIASLITLCFEFGLFIKCEDINFAGVTYDYMSNNNSGMISDKDLSSSCNANCSCSLSYFTPVCGTNNIMYLSSCAAGCTNSTKIDGILTYTNCSCVASNPVYSENPDNLTMATSGKCDNDCNLLPVFLCVVFFLMLFSFTAVIPGLSATLRCIPDKQRSFALGIQWIIIRCLGTIPGPLLFGVVIDTTCMFWLNPCGDGKEDPENGACYFYDNTLLSYYTVTLEAGFKFVAAMCYVGALVLYKAPPMKKPIEFKEIKPNNSDHPAKPGDINENKMSRYGSK